MGKIVLIFILSLYLNAYSTTYNRFMFLNSGIFLALNSDEANNTNSSVIVQEEDINESVHSIVPKLSIALVVNKKKFFRFIPSFMNSLIAYLSNKDIYYNIKLYDIDTNISSINENYILYIDTNISKVANLDFNKSIYFPLINKNEVNITKSNFYFGGIDFKEQTKLLSQLVFSKANIITSNSLIGRKLTEYEKNLSDISYIFNFPKINYYVLDDKFLYLNIKSSDIAQVLSNITANDIKTKLVLTSQIGYDPLLISLTQPQDIKNLVIANSLLNIPVVINEYSSLLSSNIRFNFINYAIDVLVNKIYNQVQNQDSFYLNDFSINMYNNQIDYKTKLFIIDKGAFRSLE